MSTQPTSVRGITKYIEGSVTGYQIFKFDPETGKQVRKRLPGATFEQAKYELAKMGKAVAEGKYSSKRATVTFQQIADVADAYYRAHRRDWATPCARLKLMTSWWGMLDCNKLTPTMIRERFDAMRHQEKEPWSVVTSNEYRSILHQSYRLAMLDDDPDNPKMRTNPASRLGKREKVFNHRERVLSPDEEIRLRAQLTSEQDAIISLALNLGCRRSNLYGIAENGRREMDGLTWNDVDVNFRVVRFPRSKSGRPYSVPLNDAALAAFQTLRAGSSGDTVLNAQSPRRWFTTALRNAKIAGLTFHDLRHTFAQRLLDNGVSQEVREALLGHEQTAIEHRYAKAGLEILRQAVATLDPKPETNQQSNQQSKVARIKRSA